MAGNSIRVNTDQVSTIAKELESLNTRLSEELQNSKQTIESLKNIWQGEAAEATQRAYAEFAANYFAQYEDVIKQYIQFLRTNVDAGYFDTESANIELAESFK